MRKLLAGAAFFASLIGSIGPSYSQVCPPVSALPDSERRVAYAPSASAGPFSVTFPVLGDGTDYGAWIEVWLNGVMLTPVTAWQLTIPSGTLSAACRPITNASITLTAPATGTLQIVGARRPRRTSQFAENVGVSARNLNQVFTDLTAQNREVWDKINDVSGRGLFSQPGNVMGPLPLPANCIGSVLNFGADGLTPTCVTGSGSGNVIGPNPTTIGRVALWNNAVGTLLTNGNIAAEISLNAGALPAAPTGTILRLAAADSQESDLTLDSFGSNASYFVARHSKGTATARTALQSGDAIGGLSFVGYGSTAYSSGGRALFGAVASQTWTDANQGTNLTITTTPNNSIVPAEVARFGSNPAFQITPAAATNNQGLLITQSGPASGTATGPISLNLMNVTSYAGGTTTAGNDLFGLLNTNVSALRVNFAVGNSIGQAHSAITGAVRQTAGGIQADMIGTQGTVYGTASQAAGAMFGLVGYVLADTGYSSTIASGGAHGAELDVGIKSGVSVARRIGLNITNISNGTATLTAGLLADWAIGVNSATAGGEWKNIIVLSKAIYGQYPTTSASTFLSADTAATPINHILDLTNFTVSGKIINSPTVVIDPLGLATFVSSGASAGTAQILTSAGASTSGFNGLDAFTAANANEVISGAFSAGNTGTVFGITKGNYAALYSAGSSNNGLLIGTTDTTAGGDPIIFGTNNVQRMQITAGGLVTIGPAFTPNSGELLTINANTAALPAGSFTGTLFHIGAANATAARIYLDTFAANSSFVFRRANNTLASRTALASGDQIGAFFWDGFDGTGYNTSDAPAIYGRAAENFAVGAHGTDIVITTIPKLAVASVTNTIFWASGGVGIGTSAADYGAGTLSISKFTVTIPTTVGALTACGGSIKGARAFVTDSNAASYTAGIGAVVAAGGATNVPVVCDGTNWRIG